jgi:ubiquinone biosynthesis protein
VVDMVEFVLEVAGVVGAVVVVRRLAGIRRGRWLTTLIAVFVGNAAAIEILRSIYGSVAESPAHAFLGAWALLIVLAVLGILLVELLTHRRTGRRRRGIPHPYRTVLTMVQRTVRYVQVGRIWVRRGLIHSGGQSEATGSRLGRSLRASFEDAGGLFIKLGQAMAQQPQLVTPAVAFELLPLQDAASPADPVAARAVITEDIGPPDEVFARFDSEPLGAASIAQTYSATLPDGRDVVVKVQRPGVAQSVEVDLDILRRLADRFHRTTNWARSIGLKDLVRGFDERTREELDFRIEASNEAAAARLVSEDDLVIVAPVVEGLTTQRVLVEERAPGRSVAAPGAFDGWEPAERQALADGLLALMLRQMVAGQPFHADPHPGNVFLRPDRRLELIDFGAVGRLDPYERAGFIDLLRGVQAEDPPLVREGFLRIGTPTGPIDEDAFDREISRAISSGVRPDGRLDPHLFERLLFVLHDFHIALPKSSTTLFRTFATLLGTLEVISPGYRVTDAAQRLGSDLLPVPKDATDVESMLAGQMTRNAHIIERLPREVDGLLRTLLHGEFRTHVSLLSDEDDVRVLRGMLGRLVTAIVAAALSLASAVLLSAGPAATLNGVRVVNILGAVGLFVGVLLLARLVISVVREEE